MSLSGGFLMQVDSLTGCMLKALIESLLSFVTIDEKMQSSNFDNSVCEHCSVTIQPFLNWFCPVISVNTNFVWNCNSNYVTSTISPGSHNYVSLQFLANTLPPVLNLVVVCMLVILLLCLSSTSVTCLDKFDKTKSNLDFGCLFVSIVKCLLCYEGWFYS